MSTPGNTTRKGRKFGTVLTVNSPPLQGPSSGETSKKIKARRVPRLSPHQGSGPSKYTVVFPAGPIGIELEPTNHARSRCRVQGLVNATTVAAASVQPGDLILSVNGKIPSSYPNAVELLKVDEAREIVFERTRKLAVKTSTPSVSTPTVLTPVPGTVNKTPAESARGKIDKSITRVNLESSSTLQQSKNSGTIPPPPPVPSTSKRRLLDRLDSAAKDKRSVSVADENQSNSADTGDLESLRVELVNFQDAIKQRDEELRKLNIQHLRTIEDLERERKATKDSVRDHDTLSAQYIALHESMKEKQQEKERDDRESKDIHRLLEEESSSLQEELKTARRNLSETVSKLASSENKNKQLEETVVRLERQRGTGAQVKEELIKSEERQSELEMELRSLNQINEQQAVSLKRVHELENEAVAKLKEQTSRLHELRQQMEDQAELLDQTQHWQAEKAMLEKQLSDTSQELIVVKEHATQLDEVKSTLETSLSSTQSQLKELKETKISENLEHKLASETTMARLFQLEEELRVKAAYCEEQEHKVRFLESKLQLVSKELEATHQHLSENITTSQRSQGAADAQLQLANDEKLKLKDQIRRLEKDFSVASDTAHAIELEAVVTAMSAKVELLEKERRVVMDSLEVSQKEVSELQKQLRTFDSEKGQLLSNLEGQIARLQNVAKENSTLKVQLDTARQDADCLNSMMEDSKQEVEALTTMRQCSIKELESVTATLECVRGELRAKDTEIKELKAAMMKDQSVESDAVVEKSDNRVLTLDIMHSQLLTEVEEQRRLRHLLDAANTTIESLNAEINSMQQVKVEQELSAAKKVESLQESLASTTAIKEKLSEEVLRLTDMLISADVKMERVYVKQEIRAEQSQRLLSKQIEGLQESETNLASKLEELTRRNEEILTMAKSFQESPNASNETPTSTNERGPAKEGRDKGQELVQMEKEISGLNQQNSDLSCRLSLQSKESSLEKDDMVSQIISLQDEIGSQRKRNLDLERLLRSMRRNTSEIEAKQKQLRGKLTLEAQGLRNDKKRLQSQHDGVKERVRLLRKEAVANREKCNEVSIEKDQLKIEAVDLRSLVDSLRHEKKLEESARVKAESSAAIEKESLSERLVEREKRIDILVQERDSLNTQLSVARDQTGFVAEMQEKMNLMKSQLEQRDGSISDLETERKRMTSELNRTTQASERNANEVARLLGVVETCRAEANENLEFVSKKHQEHVSRLTKTTNMALNDLKQTESKIQAIKRQLQNSDSKIQQLQEERDCLVAQKQQLRSELDRANASVSVLQTRLDNQADLSTSSPAIGKNRNAAAENQLRDLRVSLESSASRVSDRDQRVKQLEEDVRSMAGEIEQLSSVNVKLESTISRLSLERESTDEELETLKNQSTFYQRQLALGQKQLDEQTSRNESLTRSNQELRCSFESLTLGGSEEVQKLNRELSSMNVRLTDALSTKTTVEKSLRDAENRLAVSEQQRKQETSKLRRELDKSKEMDAPRRQEAEFLMKEKELKSKCEELGRKVESLEADEESQGTLLQKMEDRQRSLIADIDEKKAIIAEKEAEITELCGKYDELSKETSSQRTLTTTLQLQRDETEKVNAALRIQTCWLQSKTVRLESQLTEVESSYEQKLRDIDDLDRSAEERRKELCSTRDELRQACLKLEESENKHHAVVGTLQKMQDSTIVLEAEISGYRSAHDELGVKCAALETEIDSKRSDIERLNAKLQVAGAATTRIHSEKVLLEEQLLQSEKQQKWGQTELNGDYKALQVDFDVQKTKLDSLTEAFNTQQRRLLNLQSYGSQLLKFSDGILQDMNQGLTTISDLSKCITTHESAGGNGVDKLSAAIQNVLASLPSRVSELDLKSSQLRSLIQNIEKADVGSPVPRSPGSPGSPTVLDTFFKMKRVINDDILTPQKNFSHQEIPFDVEYMQRVIQALESQIDSLLADLQSANEALQAKDDLFSNLENLVIHHESQRHVLEQQLADTRRVVKELENRLSDEVAENGIADQASQALEDSSCSEAGARLLVNMFDRRDYILKAAAYRTWSCETTVAQAVSQQNMAATALAEQLDATREKLVVLKRHMKKKGKSLPSLSSISENED